MFDLDTMNPLHNEGRYAVRTMVDNLKLFSDNLLNLTHYHKIDDHAFVADMNISMIDKIIDYQNYSDYDAEEIKDRSLFIEEEYTSTSIDCFPTCYQEKVSQSWGRAAITNGTIDRTVIPPEYTYRTPYQTPDKGVVVLFSGGVNCRVKYAIPARCDNVCPKSIQKNICVPGSSDIDVRGHGTFMASIIYGGYDLGINPNIQLISIKVLNDDGTLNENAFIEGARYAAELRHERTITYYLPLNLSRRNKIGKKVIDILLTNPGAVIVNGAGNANEDACKNGFTNHPNVLSVGAVDKDYVKLPESNHGYCTNIWAPGKSVIGADHRGLLTTREGTGVAAAHVAAAVSKLSWMNDPVKIRAAIRNSAFMDRVKGLGPENRNRFLSICQDAEWKEKHNCVTP